MHKLYGAAAGHVCHGRNMPPFYGYEKLAQISPVTILVKWTLVNKI